MDVRDVVEMNAADFALWCTEHAGEPATRSLLEPVACDGWYPEIDSDGDLTGEIVEATGERHELVRDTRGHELGVRLQQNPTNSN